MIEFAWTAVILLLFYLSVVIFGVDSRDGEDWYRRRDRYRGGCRHG